MVKSFGMVAPVDRSTIFLRAVIVPATRITSVEMTEDHMTTTASVNARKLVPILVRIDLQIGVDFTLK